MELSCNSSNGIGPTLGGGNDVVVVACGGMSLMMEDAVPSARLGNSKIEPSLILARI